MKIHLSELLKNFLGTSCFIGVMSKLFVAIKFVKVKYISKQFSIRKTAR